MGGYNITIAVAKGIYDCCHATQFISGTIIVISARPPLIHDSPAPPLYIYRLGWPVVTGSQLKCEIVLYNWIIELLLLSLSVSCRRLLRLT